MARRKRRRQEARRPTLDETAEAASPGDQRDTGWRWRTFPVFFALSVGLLIASIVNGRPDNVVGAAVQIAALLGVGYGLAHMIVRNIVVAGRTRRAQDRAAPRDDEEWEEEIVHPDDAARS